MLLLTTAAERQQDFLHAALLRAACPLLRREVQVGFQRRQVRGGADGLRVGSEKSIQVGCRARTGGEKSLVGGCGQGVARRTIIQGDGRSHEHNGEE